MSRSFARALGAAMAAGAVVAAVAAPPPAPPPAPAPASLVAVASRSPWTLRELEAAGAAFASWDPETGTAHVVATAAEIQRLQAAGFAVATLAPDVDAGRAGIVAARALGAYHTFAECESALVDLAARFPDWCRLESIGKSIENRDLWALKISDAPAEDDAAEPDVLIMGCHHAREFMSVEVPLHFARTLLEDAATNARLRGLIETRELWVVPMVNPDGHVYQEEFAAGPDWSPPGWRKNRRSNFDGTTGVDLNRNYGFQWGLDEEGSSGDGLAETYRGSAAWSEPETRAVRDLVERQRFVIALTYHSYGSLWLYPWGHTRGELTEDHAVFAALADSMVRSNGYRAGNAALGTIYLTNGECTDFLYGEVNIRKPQRTFAFTPELNSSAEGGFWPPEARIAPTCAAMWPANLFALEVAGAARRPLPPPAPVLAATQDPADGRRIALSWAQPSDADNPVSHWEVFEIAPAGAVTTVAADLAASGRAMLAQALPRPGSGRLAIRFDATLAPLWDYAYVEARAPGSEWVRLRGDATRDTSPTGRNAGQGLTGGIAGRTLVFELDAVTGDRIDVSVRLDAVASAPRTLRLRAQVDVAATYGEERRVIAPDVREPHYDVVADRPGLFAYGVTAVDRDGQHRDSEIFFFVIPTVAVALADVHVAREGAVSRLSWSGDVRDATLEVWTRALAPDAPVPGAVSAWASAGLVRVAATAVQSARSGQLEWAATAARELVVLRVHDATGGDRLAGAWAIESGLRTRIVSAANPCRGGGPIEFEIATAGRVDLEVFAADGRRVRTLWAARRAAGRSHVVWDGRDDSGRVLAAGVYFVRLQHAGVVAGRRVVLLR